MDIETLNTGHNDTIHDLCYDYYGRRLATVSSDRMVKIWEPEHETKSWRCQASWHAHDAAVLRVEWAHPEFSPSLIATCSLDRKVIMWEDRGQDDGRWHEVASLMESRYEVRDIAFCPRHLGLRLASASADGFVRIYEALDPGDLYQWPLVDEFLGAGGTTADDTNEAQRIALSALSWNPCPVDPAEMVVGCDDGSMRIWRYNPGTTSWVVKMILVGHKDRINDIAWAPNPGRPFHLIASASKDGGVSVWKVPLNDNEEAQAGSEAVILSPVTRIEEQPHVPVWRVKWNVTGTMLSSSSDSGLIKLYRSWHSELKIWECCGSLGTQA